MLFTYSLDQNDYLDYLFYSTSKSKKVQKRRALNKLVLMVIYVVTGLMLYNRSGPIASAVFFLLCLPLYFLYSLFEKKQYTRHFVRFINDHFNDRIGKVASIELKDDGFDVIDDENNQYTYEDIEEVSETNSLVIVQLKSGTAILLPKNKIQNWESLSERLSERATVKSVKYTKQLNWKWR